MRCCSNFDLFFFSPYNPWPVCTLGWNKASLSVDASEENNGYSSSEDPMNSDTEDEAGKKLVSPEPSCHHHPTSRQSSFKPDFAVFANPLGSREVHGDSRLWEGGTSGAVCQERRHCPANPRRRGRTMVSPSGQKECSLLKKKSQRTFLL